MNSNWKRAGALLMGIFTANPTITEDEKMALQRAIDEDAQELKNTPPSAEGKVFDAADATAQIVALATGEFNAKLEAERGKITALQAEVEQERAKVVAEASKFSTAEAERARLQGLWDAHQAALNTPPAGEVTNEDGGNADEPAWKVEQRALQAKWGDLVPKLV